MDVSYLQYKLPKYENHLIDPSFTYCVEQFQ